MVKMVPLINGTIFTISGRLAAKRPLAAL